DRRHGTSRRGALHGGARGGKRRIGAFLGGSDARLAAPRARSRAGAGFDRRPRRARPRAARRPGARGVRARQLRRRSPTHDGAVTARLCGAHERAPRVTRRSILVTGFPASRARAVLVELARREPEAELLALVHPERAEEARLRARDLGLFERERLRIVEGDPAARSEEHTSELQSRENLVCRLLLEKKKNNTQEVSH